MPRQLNRRQLLLLAVAVAVALSLTLLSSVIQRNGPELASYGNMCGPSSDQDCLEPVLNAGFPFGYLFDQPGVSIERQLFFVEDNLRPVPFALDFLAYLSLVALAFRLTGRLRTKASRSATGGDA